MAADEDERRCQAGFETTRIGFGLDRANDGRDCGRKVARLENAWFQRATVGIPAERILSRQDAARSPQDAGAPEIREADEGDGGDDIARRRGMDLRNKMGWISRAGAETREQRAI